ncbi:hypothetical protein BGZ83_009353 [Gryganskiella cystojenkinii]|nr:hypothetical protein BGZ83_009353 [Gryganskiella cystojenkinii]
MSIRQLQQRDPLDKSHERNDEQDHQLNNDNDGPNPLAIPEILLLLTRFINRSDIVKACLRVSREWHQTFLPTVWALVNMNLKERQYHEGPSIEALDKHSSLVRKLYLVPTNILDLTYNRQYPLQERQPPILFPNLSTLHILEYDSGLSRGVEEKLVSLIKRHQLTLKNLRLASVHSEKIFDAITGCTLLEKLIVGGLDNFSFDIWMKESRSDSNIAIVDMKSRLENANETRLLDITIRTGHSNEIMDQTLKLLIQKSPDLNRLYWVMGPFRVFRQQPQMSLLADLARTGLYCQLLETLIIHHAQFENHDLLIVLEFCAALRNLDLEQTSFGIESWQMLQQGLPQSLAMLKTLSIRNCNNVTGALVYSILCSLPSLEVFRGNYIRDTDFLQTNRSWVCAGLKELHLVFFACEKNPTSTRLAVLDHLSTLSLLEVLDMDPTNIKHRINNVDSADPSFAVSRRSYMNFTLDLGLDKLKTLGRLRVVNGPGLTHWGVEVMKHWPQLHRLEGFKCADREVKRLLRPCIEYLNLNDELSQLAHIHVIKSIE